MRTEDVQQGGLFSYISLESRIPLNHPIRKLRVLVDTILKEMDADFAPLYSSVGRPSIPPERLLRALLLQIVFSVRSERLLMERMDYDLLFRWFVGLDLDDPVWDHSTFSFNRERLFGSQVAEKFFRNTVLMARVGKLTSDEHFTVDGSLIQSHASLKSLKQIERQASKNDDNDRGDGPSSSGERGRNPSVDFKGERRTNATHQSTTDPEAKLYRKSGGVGAFLCHSGHALTENRHGLVMGVRIDEASGTAERENTLRMLDHVERRHGVRPATLGADKGYDAGPFLVELERRWIEPHVAIKSGKIDPTGDHADDGTWARWFVRSEQRRAAFKKSQRRRKLVEEFFGWAKTVAGMRRARHVGREKIRQCFELAAAAYNLVRMRNLLAA